MGARLMAAGLLAIAAPAAHAGLNPTDCTDVSGIAPFTQFRYGQIQAIFDVLVVVNPEDPLVAQCTRCHEGGIGAAGLGLSADVSYENLVGVQSTLTPLLRIAPGIPDQSWLYIKINCDSPGVGSRMPQDTAALSATQQRFVFDWIRLGAPLSKNGFEDR
jgi:hypothetical protein